MRSMAASSPPGATASSSIASRTSPARTPARSAGEAAIGLTTTIRPSRSATSRPTPEYCPVVLTRIAS